MTLVLAPPDDAYFEERFARFDVSHATCFDPVERDRLLATIEAGFGGLDQFNASLKGVVADLLKRAADAPRGLERSFSVRASTVICDLCFTLAHGFYTFLQRSLATTQAARPQATVPTRPDNERFERRATLRRPKALITHSGQFFGYAAAIRTGKIWTTSPQGVLPPLDEAGRTEAPLGRLGPRVDGVKAV